MRKREKVVPDFVAEFGISKATAYRHVGPDGELRASAMRVLELQNDGRCADCRAAGSGREA
jgi:hypothetical protein